MNNYDWRQPVWGAVCLPIAVKKASHNNSFLVLVVNSVRLQLVSLNNKDVGP